MDIYPLLRALLFRLPPENAHSLTLRGLGLAARLGLAGWLYPPPPRLPRTVMGLEFPNPVGLAAGMDKNADCIAGFFALGFGFVEVGTVTPRPQHGNPRPRLFRLPARQAIINRMGFNNRGLDYLLDNVRQAPVAGPLGINIGKNFDTPLESAVEDYLIGLRKVYPHADYITVNISSPNTPGLRRLQHGAELQQMLEALKNEQARLHSEYGKYVPLAVKIAPDLEAEEVRAVARTLVDYRIDGVIATNTTNSREGVEGDACSGETGGLSGAPLLQRSTEVVRLLRAEAGDRLPIIACGGITRGEHAQEKIQAGADLVQLYTGLIYQGPALIRAAAEALRQAAFH